MFFTKSRIGLSLANEPENDLILNDNHLRRYPDMEKLYSSMSEFFGVDVENIILGNGCDNIIKNALLALKVKTMYWSTPTWAMIDVFCQQLGIEKVNQAFGYDQRKNILHEKAVSIEKPYVYYGTEYANNLYANDMSYEMMKKSEYVIIDTVYVSPGDLRLVVNKYKADPKVIIVGSFDKYFGAGLRLGFAIFSASLSNAFFLQRERCLNACASQFIQKKMYEQVISKPYYDRLINMHLDKVSTVVTQNYVSVPYDIECSINAKKFNVDGKTFTRFGIPSNDEEFESLKTVLSMLR